MKNLGIVWGYLPDIDEQAAVAKEAYLHQRLSLVLNRYPDTAPGVFEIFFDKEFLRQILVPVLHTITYDRVEACDWFEGRHSTVDEAFVIDSESHEVQTFRWVKCFAQDRLVCYIEHEDYENWGGPHPYHDAFVYAIYLHDIERLSFQQHILRTALEHDILLCAHFLSLSCIICHYT